jgi:hypothetical protein
VVPAADTVDEAARPAPRSVDSSNGPTANGIILLPIRTASDLAREFGRQTIARLVSSYPAEGEA